MIFANGTSVVTALKQVTRTIPIIFAVVNDPVSQGFIDSLAHPGGNITGFTFVEFTMFGKWLSILQTASPAGPPQRRHVQPTHVALLLRLPALVRGFEGPNDASAGR
jgi:hypothetical protein